MTWQDISISISKRYEGKFSNLNTVSSQPDMEPPHKGIRTLLFSLLLAPGYVAPLIIYM